MKNRLIPNYPTNPEWGPAYWGILHGLAERAGRYSSNISRQKNERTKWISLFTSLSNALPCDECREHYDTMLTTANISTINTISYSELKTFIRTTLWSMHNTVNVRLEKPVFSYENLEATYASVDPLTVLKQVKPTIEKAANLGGMKQSDWIKFSNVVKTIYSM